MQCQLCIQDPATHSFEQITQSPTKHMPIFYTSFKNVKDYSNSVAILHHITSELNRVDIQSGWIWVLDCKYMTAKHMVQMQVCMGIIKFLQSTYSGTLRALYVINGGTILNTALTAIYPFLTAEFIQRIHKLSGTPLELFEQLKGLGWDLPPLMQRLVKEYTV